jgi:hypothetical protein
MFAVGFSLGTYFSFRSLEYLVIPSERAPKVLGSEEAKPPVKKDPSLREPDYEETSPDRQNRIIRYKIKDYNENLYSNYHGYLDSNVLIALASLEEEREKYIFVGEERTGDPHWLGNDYIFFTTYCGTSCQGIYLIDTRNKESELGVISYLFEGERWVTHFRDWFGGEFVFEGLLDEVRSEMNGLSPVLIFNMKDDRGNFLGERKMLFMGKSLKSI